MCNPSEGTKSSRAGRLSLRSVKRGIFLCLAAWKGVATSNGFDPEENVVLVRAC